MSYVMLVYVLTFLGVESHSVTNNKSFGKLDVFLSFTNYW